MKKKTVKATFVMVCCILLTGCKNNQAVMPEAEYATLRVSSADRQLTDTYPATIRGRQDIDIFPQVGGFISEVVVKEGQKVRKGETLFIIDQVPYKAAYQTAEANVEAAKAGVSTAQLVYDSKKKNCLTGMWFRNLIFLQPKIVCSQQKHSWLRQKHSLPMPVTISLIL